MLDFDRWQEIKNALTANKLRTGLTAFGVFWGIFLLVVMLGSGNGLRNGALQGFGDGATNTFFLWSQRTGKPYAGLPSGRRPQLTNEDVAAIKEEITEAQFVAPRNQLGGFRGGNNVTRKSKTGGFGVVGDHPQVLLMDSIKMVEGRFLNPIDLEERRKVAVIGRRVQDILFEKGERPIGDSIQVQGVYFQVIGVFRSTSPGTDGEQEEQQIYVPFTTFQSAFNFANRVGWLAITAKSGIPASVVEEKTIALLKQRHRVAPDDNRAFGHFNLEEEFNKVNGLMLGIRTLVWIVGIGTLAAGAIGVSNIMMIIIRERTREIGVRRAIGARPRAIVGQILLESVFLTSIAGYFGLVAGVGLLELVAKLTAGAASERTMFLNPGVSFGNALQALAILVAAGLVAGFIPAQRAVAVNPVVALRSE
jgi:putative ABC transport system permease protein